MSTIIFVLVFCIVALLVYMARYSGRLRIEHTRLIDAPIAEVCAKVADFRHWNEWSPWLAPENDAEVTLSDKTAGVGSRCAWNSSRSGVGMIEHVRVVRPDRIEQRIRCQLPFAFRGRSTWRFVERAGQTEVTWRLRGRVGFSLRFVAQTVQASVALDYRYAMDRLARLVEPDDAPHYGLAHLGVREIAASHYVYRSYQGTLTGLGAARHKILTGLQQQLARHGVRPSGAPLAVYVKTSTKLRTTLCHIGIPVGEGQVGELPLRELPAHRAYVVRLQGNHAALDMAWYQAMQRMMAENIQPDQRLPPFERYLVHADTARENDYLTELHIPVL